MVGKLAAREEAGLLLVPAVDDISTVDEITMHPAEFGKLTDRTTLWKSQKRVGDMDKI